MAYLTSINPSNNSVIGKIEITTNAEITNKVTQAHAAKKQWKSFGVSRRAEILMPLLNIMKKYEKEIAQLTTQEMGKPITQSAGGFEWDLSYFEHFLTEGVQSLTDVTTVKNEKEFHKVVYEPRGVAACISPWNYPLSNVFWGIIPNLVAGNPVVSKVSELCSLSGKLFENIMMELKDLPIGVFSQIYGGKEQGEFLANQDINFIWFTGSSAVGKKLLEIAGKKQIKAVLEMGGSNPAIVFEDVDIDSIIPNILQNRFNNCGQVCAAIKRLIIHQSRFSELIEKLASAVSKIKIGNPELESTEMGPLASFQQLATLENQVKKSLEMGAKVIVGGERPEGFLHGAFYKPTILTNISFDMPVWKEEVFGPVLPVIAFHSEEEATQLANDTQYGLGASIYSKDIERARRVAAQIDAGNIEINCASRWHPNNPFGGYKSSGMGCEHGKWGFAELCQLKVIAEPGCFHKHS